MPGEDEKESGKDLISELPSSRTDAEGSRALLARRRIYLESKCLPTLHLSLCLSLQECEPPILPPREKLSPGAERLSP